MRRSRLSVVAAFCGSFLCSACPNSAVNLPQTPTPSASTVQQKLNLGDMPYLDDPTYVSDPKQLLGQVAVIRHKEGHCPSAALPAGGVTFEEVIAGFNYTNATTPELLQSVLVSKRIAGEVNVLQYLTGQLNDSTLFKLLVTSQASQRVDMKDTMYRKLRSQFIATNPLARDSSVCWLLEVDGYIHQTIARTKYHRLTGKADAKAYGVNVGGTYYSSNEDYSLDHRFGLSLSVLRRPDAYPSLLASDSLTTDERNMLKGVTIIPRRGRLAPAS